MEKVAIKNSNGKNIAAVIHRPETRTEKLAILCPGYLDSKDYPHLVDLAERLAKEGYTAVRFDPTGTWDSEGNISEYTNTQYLRDVASVLEHMLAEAAYTYVLLGGHSRGGTISLLYAAKDKRISAVLDIMGSGKDLTTEKQHEDWKKAGTRTARRDIAGQTGEKIFTVPYSHLQDRAKYDVSTVIQDVHVPILLLAGEQDEIVSPSTVQEIFDSAQEPKQFIIVPGIGHDYRHNPSEIALVHNIVIEALV